MPTMAESSRSGQTVRRGLSWGGGGGGGVTAGAGCPVPRHAIAIGSILIVSFANESRPHLLVVLDDPQIT